MEISPESQSNDAKYMKLKQLCLTRSKQIILQNLTVDFPCTGVTVLLGANGAGKSTLLSAISGISEPDSGKVELIENTSVCLMSEPAVFYPHLTVSEQLRFVAELFNKKADESLLTAAIYMWQLEGVKDKLTQHLSLGFRQRLSLAQLTVSQAEIWLLDEPMNGMDPQVLSVFKDQMQIMKDSKSIVMATHIMHEAQELADWVMVMHQGEIIYSDSYDQFTPFYDLYHQAMQAHQLTFN